MSKNGYFVKKLRNEGTQTDTSSESSDDAKQSGVNYGHAEIKSDVFLSSIPSNILLPI